MITIMHYEIINGSKSNKIPFVKTLKNRKELDALRDELEKENNCWKEINSITGGEREKVKDIMITYGGQ